ncbi:hypothetical protein [Streptomyces sp. NPDC056401]
MAALPNDTGKAPDPRPGAPSRALRIRAAGGWERFMRRVDAEQEGTE